MCFTHFLKTIFSRRFFWKVLSFGQYSRAVSSLERVMMARVQYINVPSKFNLPHYAMKAVSSQATSSCVVSHCFGPLMDKTIKFFFIHVTEIYIQSAPNNSNETYTFMCLGRPGRFGQCTVMRFQQFQSHWNKNLPNLNSQD